MASDVISRASDVICSWDATRQRLTNPHPPQCHQLAHHSGISLTGGLEQLGLSWDEMPWMRSSPEKEVFSRNEKLGNSHNVAQPDTTSSTKWKCLSFLYWDFPSSSNCDFVSDGNTAQQEAPNRHKIYRGFRCKTTGRRDFFCDLSCLLLSPHGVGPFIFAVSHRLTKGKDQWVHVGCACNDRRSPSGCYKQCCWITTILPGPIA